MAGFENNDNSENQIKQVQPPEQANFNAYRNAPRDVQQAGTDSSAYLIKVDLGQTKVGSPEFHYDPADAGSRNSVQAHLDKFEQVLNSGDKGAMQDHFENNTKLASAVGTHIEDLNKRIALLNV